MNEQLCQTNKCSYGRLCVPSTLRKGSPLLFIGENPSWAEIQGGAPFLGPAGKKLNQLLEMAGIIREEVSLCNLTMCMDSTREKKNPIAEEIDRCWPRLVAEIEEVQPKVLVLLGGLPMAQFFEGISSITKVRGKPRIWHGLTAIATWHPARVLPFRSPEAEPLLYEDLLLAKNLVEGDTG